MDDGLSVVVPVYNSEATLPLLIQRLQTVLELSMHPFEVLLVNDGSADASWTVIQEISSRLAWVRGLDLMRNYGQHNALLAGIRAARYGITITLDDDLQNPPEEIPLLLGKLREGYAAVYGRPRNARHGLWRNLASRISKLVLQRSMGAETARQISSFRAFRTNLRKAFEDFRGPYVSVDVLLTWGTTHFAVVDVRHDERLMGQSNYTVGMLIRHAINMTTGFSVWPLRAASLTGFALTLVGLALLFFVVGRRLLFGDSVPGFPFLASAICLFSGAQLFALGIIGEYLAGLHFRAMDKPPYAIAKQTG
ncbi:MAG: glycosyltransferase family 2 protein [Phycisphaerales bacterium]|nr:glycosyltransferase family 2 protein [Phycisphaerales bacterium]